MAGWGLGKNGKRSKKLLWAKLVVKSAAECRTNQFIHSLKKDLKQLTGKNNNKKLTWKNIKKIGLESESRDIDGHTLVYFPVIQRMHICAGDVKKQACSVSICTEYILLQSKCQDQGSILPLFSLPHSTPSGI